MGDPGLASKFIEMQQEEAARPDERLDTVEAARRARLESLRLSRARTVEQLKGARNRNHRAMLKRALAHIESEITSEGVSP